MLAVGMTVRIARLPEGEDPDSLLRSKGALAFKDCLDKASSIVAFQVEIARSKETNPESYDAISRTGRAVLELVKKCPVAVMRAGLMQEAATLLKIPVSALEEDLAKISEEKPHFVARHEVAKSINNKTSPSEQYRQEDVIFDDVVIPEEYQFEDPTGENASAPENNPPPSLEMVLMEFLFGLGVNTLIADMLDSYAPNELFEHQLTGAFVRAYVRETRGESDAIVNLKNEIPVADTSVLEDIFFSKNRAALSELGPADNLRKLLCRFWFDAVSRKLKTLPISGDADLMRRRNKLSLLTRKFKAMPWHVASQSMTLDVFQD
jgi:DNA primase